MNRRLLSYIKLICISLVAFASTVFAEDRALVVGVDVYKDGRVNDTPGAADDAKAMRGLLIDKFNFAPGAVKILLNEEASAANILDNFQTWLVNETQPGDRVFFFYAGHGFQAPDDNGDEEDGQDEIITPHDVIISSQSGKISLPNEQTFIRDDKFNDFIAQLSGRRAVLMFDSCHSGTLSRSLNKNGQDVSSRYLKLKPTRSITDNKSYSDVPPPGKPRDLYTIREEKVAESVNGVVVLSAASPYQQAFPIALDGSMRGAFSYVFGNLIKKNEKENLADLSKELKREMEKLAESGQIGKSENGQFQVPQIEILSKVRLDDKPLFAGGAAGENYLAAAESALFNPLSKMSVKLDVKGRRFKLGDTINYSVNVGENSYLYILVFSADNKAFCIFPNPAASEQTNFLMKGEYNFPRGEYTTVATEPVGKDVWVALVSKKKLNLGEKEEYTWTEIFKRIGLGELQKAIMGKTRGAGNAPNSPLAAGDWQASTVVVETTN